MDSTSADFAQLPTQNTPPRAVTTNSINTKLNIISIVFTLASIYLIKTYYYPRIEIDYAFLIFLPGAFGISLFIVKNASKVIKEAYIVCLYLFTTLFTILALAFMIFNYSSPFFAPFINKIMTIVFILGWDMVFIGCARMLAEIIANNEDKQKFTKQTQRVANIVTQNEIIIENSNVCPIHGEHEHRFI